MSADDGAFLVRALYVLCVCAGFFGTGCFLALMQILRILRRFEREWL